MVCRWIVCHQLVFKTRKLSTGLANIIGWDLVKWHKWNYWKAENCFTLSVTVIVDF